MPLPPNGHHDQYVINETTTNLSDRAHWPTKDLPRAYATYKEAKDEVERLESKESQLLLIHLGGVEQPHRVHRLRGWGQFLRSLFR